MQDKPQIFMAMKFFYGDNIALLNNVSRSVSVYRKSVVSDDGTTHQYHVPYKECQ